MESDRQLAVIANVLPVAATAAGRRCGMVTAVEPLLAATGGVWIAPQVAEPAAASAPPASYGVTTLPISREDEQAFSDNVCHAGLWPLCHRAGVAPTFDGVAFDTYRAVNARIADLACRLAREAGPVVFVQNYHFALAPRRMREQWPSASIAAFWHVPWPGIDRLEKCPWHREVLDGLLASDVLGFQTPIDCVEFLDSAERLVGADVDRGDGVVRHRGRDVLVRDYPTSVPWPGDWTAAGSPDVCRAAVRRALNLPADVRLGVGLDRLDYAKGIPGKFAGIERLLDIEPALAGRFVFVQLVEPGHARLHLYRDERRRMLAAADRVNARFGRAGYQPILVVEGVHAHATIARYFRAADFCFVGSRHDGMNLESKEFVAARDDEQGVLVLSGFAGATCELADAVVIDPTDADDTAAGLAAALSMPPADQRERMRRLREVVASHDAVRWGREILRDTCRRHTPQVTR
jgi:trehalose 6-phosphate synthase